MQPTPHANLPIDDDSPAAIQRLLTAEGLGMRKRFGQNFLVNPRARACIIDALAVQPGDLVWEVGPGLGAMTAGLLQRGAAVQAFEIDPGFIRFLPQRFPNAVFIDPAAAGTPLPDSAVPPSLTIVAGDVLKTWRAGSDAAVRFLGNLPYTIGARLLGDLIAGNRFFTRMVVTLQKEVADRMRARPGDAAYSAFSVLIGLTYTVTPLMTLKGGSFYPPPHVESQALCLDRRGDAPPIPAGLIPLVHRLFASRRKMVRNTLLAAAGSPDRADAALAAAGVAGTRRPETLPPAAFIALAQALAAHGAA